jgi:hypothetical protein
MMKAWALRYCGSNGARNGIKGSVNENVMSAEL